MKSTPFTSEPGNKLRIWGAFDFDQRPEGLGVRRLPAWTRPQVPEGLDVMARMPSGVRIQLKTDSTRIELNALSTSLRYSEEEGLRVPYQLQVGDEITTEYGTQGNRIQMKPDSPNGFEVIRGEADRIVFDSLSNQVKFCEIWLPHNAFVELRSISIDDHADLLPLEKEARRKWVHYGSSISHCMEARVPSEVWPAVAARRGDIALTNFGFGGQCHLDPFVARTIADLNCDLISVKVGINVINMNSMKERVFTPLLHGFLDTIREKQPTTPILLISPIFCPSAEDRPGPTIPDTLGKYQTNPSNDENDGSMSLKRVRSILQTVVDQRAESGDKYIRYFNGLELFNADDRGDLPDDLHPNPEGYIRMGNRFYEKYLRGFLT